MRPDDLRELIDALDQQIGFPGEPCTIYSADELFELDIIDHPHEARLLLARAAFHAGFARSRLDAGDVTGAFRYYSCAQGYFADAAWKVARPTDLARIASPLAKRGPKGSAAKLLYLRAEKIRRRDGVKIAEACRRAVAADDALAVRYSSQSDVALISVYKRGRKALESNNCR